MSKEYMEERIVRVLMYPLYSLSTTMAEQKQDDPYLPTPLLGQDMTQGQFLSGF